MKCPKCDSEMKDKIIGDECIKCGFIKEAEK